MVVIITGMHRSGTSAMMKKSSHTKYEIDMKHLVHQYDSKYMKWGFKYELCKNPYKMK